jgi:DNA-binding MarR family transcriptional regulator/GNAT superfamily N-acetyltransferase
MSDTGPQSRVAAVRRFNRFYTRKIGVLREAWLQSPFSLTEARVLFELNRRDRPTASELVRELDLDPGYLSRILRSMKKRGLVESHASELDGRQSLLSPTAKGRKAFEALDSQTSGAVATMLESLSGGDQARLVESMGTIERLLGGQADTRVPYVLRPHRPGDMGWIVSCHGALYAEEYGWDGHEPLAADIVAEFLRTYDPKRMRCWIAERNGRNVGSALLMRKSDKVAQLRLLQVVPDARGLGIGARLVDECVEFARRSGYRKIVLWTQSILLPARQIYERAGFRLLREEPHHSFGHDLVGEIWELKL